MHLDLGGRVTGKIVQQRTGTQTLRSFRDAGWPVLSRSEGRGCSAGAVSLLRAVCSRSPTARNSSLTPISEPHDLPLSSHFSCTLITDTQSQSRNNSPTVQHRKLRPSPETDPLSAANHFGGSLTKGRQVHK